MPYITLQSDRNKFSKFRGSGVFSMTNNRLPTAPLNNRQIYSKKGGIINLSDIINIGKTVVDVVKDNKDLIQSGVSTVKSVSDTIGAITDTVKVSKELEKIKQVNEIKKNKNKNKKTKEVVLSSEEKEALKALGTKTGEGFVKF